MEQHHEQGEHEVYGGEIPDEGEMDVDIEISRENLEEMKKRLKEIKDEVGALHPDGVDATQSEKEEVDSRSIYVGHQHFQSCGIVNRVTILTDKFGQPKGFVYVEFVEVDAVSAKRTNVPGMKQFRGRAGY
ncbi:hypothetical protein MKX01_035325, partial [Papaver californicum]